MEHNRVQLRIIEGIEWLNFFPALAHTDSVGYLDERGKRNLMSVLRLLPENMQKRALMSLSFDESIHYDTTLKTVIKNRHP